MAGLLISGVLYKIYDVNPEGPAFGGFPREAAESAAFRQRPVRFDNRRLVGPTGPEPGTDLVVAVGQALVYMGCLESGGPT